MHVHVGVLAGSDDTHEVRVAVHAECEHDPVDVMLPQDIVELVDPTQHRTGQ